MLVSHAIITSNIPGMKPWADRRGDQLLILLSLEMAVAILTACQG